MGRYSMHLKQLILIIAIFLMALPDCFPQQFTYPWNFKDSTGKIQDMHFMPGDSEFIYTTDGGHIRVRNTETGELKREWQGIQGKFAFTADSQKIVLINEAKIELRKLSDMSLVASDSLELGADTLEPQYHTKLKLKIIALAADPIKPFVYLVEKKSNFKFYPFMVDTTLIVSYNYNTMKQMEQFTKKSTNEHFFDAVLDVSKDGKYLAALNDQAAYLQVWDLPTLKQIRKFALYDTLHYNQDPEKYSCMITDLKFSNINTENIYFSGYFPNFNYSNSRDGLLEYNIQMNDITDTTFARIGSGPFTLFDNEHRILFLSSKRYVNNLSSKVIEYQASINYPEPGTWALQIYSKKYDIFIGSANEYCSSGIYNSGTSTGEDTKVKKVLFPNPTSSLVAIETNCVQGIINYQIHRPNGELVEASSKENTNNSIQIDFSPYPNGVYFITLICGSQNTTYKVIKEG
jgi:hypothetical protein